MMFWIALLFLFCTQKGEERNEEIREIFGNDWGIDGDYVLYDVFQCLRPRSYLFQPNPPIYGTNDGRDDGDHHAIVYVEDV